MKSWWTHISGLIKGKDGCVYVYTSSQLIYSIAIHSTRSWHTWLSIESRKLLYLLIALDEFCMGHHLFSWSSWNGKIIPNKKKNPFFSCAYFERFWQRKLKLISMIVIYKSRAIWWYQRLYIFNNFFAMDSNGFFYEPIIDDTFFLLQFFWGKAKM